MSAQTPLEVVQQAHDAISRGDLPAYLDLLSEDVELVYQGPTVIPFAGTWRGRDGVTKFFTLLGDAVEIDQFESQELVAEGDTVVALGSDRHRVKATDRTYEQEFVGVHTVRNGRITRLRVFENAAAFLMASGAG
jgi:uncharacterized protein